MKRPLPFSLLSQQYTTPAKLISRDIPIRVCPAIYAMAERVVVRIALSSSHSEHESDTELEMKTKKKERPRRSNSENRLAMN